MNRELFIKLFNKYNLNDLFYDKVAGNKFTELKHYLIYLDQDLEQVTILNRYYLECISWYKYLHVGRDLEIVGLDNEEELDNFLKVLSEDLK